jgi:hypothetical protein
VLALAVPVRVARQLAADDLAVGPDAVPSLGVDHVAAGAARDDVAPPVGVHGDAVAAVPAYDHVAPAAAFEEVVASAAFQAVVPAPAVNRVRGGRSGNPVRAIRARYVACSSRSRRYRDCEDYDRREPHRSTVARPGGETPGVTIFRPMRAARRLSQAISEGDGISVLVHVRDAEAARAAEEQGAEGIVLVEEVAGVRGATSLPILWGTIGSLQRARTADADACLLVVRRYDDDGALVHAHAEAQQLGLECVVEVGDDEELERALEAVDPEIFLLTSGQVDADDDPLEGVLDLLPDVPAGKLAIADAPVATRDDVVALERAGVDAVIVRRSDVAELVGGAPPEV